MRWRARSSCDEVHMCSSNGVSIKRRLSGSPKPRGIADQRLRELIDQRGGQFVDARFDWSRVRMIAAFFLPPIGEPQFLKDCVLDSLFDWNLVAATAAAVHARRSSGASNHHCCPSGD